MKVFLSLNTVAADDICWLLITIPEIQDRQLSEIVQSHNLAYLYTDVLYATAVIHRPF